MRQFIHILSEVVDILSVSTIVYYTPISSDMKIILAIVIVKFGIIRGGIDYSKKYRTILPPHCQIQPNDGAHEY